MKRNKTTKMTAVLLCAAMLLMALVSGCGGGGTPSDADKAKEALVGTWYKKYTDSEGNEKWSDQEYTFYENGTYCRLQSNGERWYTWELMDSQEKGNYTLMLVKDKNEDWSLADKRVYEIKFDGSDHITAVLTSEGASGSVEEYYKDTNG